MVARFALFVALTSIATAALVFACVPDYSFSDAPDAGGDAATTSDATAGIDAADTQPSRPGETSDAAADAHEAGSPRDAAVMVRVPEGGPVTLNGATVTLSHAFRLDRYEVTVGRVSAWDVAGRPAPCNDGATACDLEPIGPYAGRMQWDPSWNAEVKKGAFAGAGCLPANNTAYATPTYPSGDPTLPVTCVSWYQAVAICAFEGKRLPTEAEWQYEASGRTGTRTYAWGNDDPVGCTKATWANNDPQNNGCGWPKPAGAASSGGSIDTALDLSGSVYEWVWDWSDVPFAGGIDPVGPLGSDGGLQRGTRGGSWATAPSSLTAANRDTTSPSGTYADIGFRCAQSIP